MYGGGALVIREVTRRTGRGWPTVLLLALAYGLFEEGIATQSLFNPDYAGAHLLDQGFVPALGIAVPWTLYVLALHTVWSITVPIALVEEASSRRTTPWLRTPGLVVASVLLAVGAFGTTMASYGMDSYVAPWPKLATVLVLVALLVVAAFLVPARPRTPGAVPGPWAVLAVTLAGGALFMSAKWLPDRAGVPAMLAAFVLVTEAILRWSRRDGWAGRHRLAAAAGGLLTYAWHSFTTQPLAGGGAVVTPVSHAFFALCAVVLLVWEARRVARAGDARQDGIRAERS
ncbi:hypothetical protein [Actinoplanes sp. NPDC049316]|uniref:hypothetical protein n=1 Tax=Actinoplanes sp. NPDC049316 TaxID=3154727 RepID=UPI003412340E